MKTSEKVVAYFYDEEIGNFNYGGGNPMRPHRVRLTHALMDGYNLFPKLRVHRPQPRSFQELTEFHADEYIDFLRSVTPNNQEEYMAQLRRFNLGVPGEADCPVFDGLFEYCQMYSGGSVDGAAIIAQGKSDIALNWAGGMHHAKKAEASGFCYVNDIVLAILELLKSFQRVLYVDIDIHHGDGVEEAFYLTDRVMTVSFHKYGDFFPGTGHVEDIGYQGGRHYTVNVPLHEGMDDESYRFMFEPIMQKVMEVYQPGALVVCAGADSLSGDRLGCFNLSLEGHSNCLEFLSRFNVPMLVLGGGGYTMRNVSRCWCYETGRLMGQDLPDVIPEASTHDFNYFMDTSRLRIAVSNMKNSNTREELERIKTEVLQNLSKLPAAPGAQMAPRPPQHRLAEQPEEEMDARGGGQAHNEWRHVRDGDESDEEEVKLGMQRDADYRELTPAAQSAAEPGPSGRASVDSEARTTPAVKAEMMDEAMAEAVPAGEEAGASAVDSEMAEASPSGHHEVTQGGRRWSGEATNGENSKGDEPAEDDASLLALVADEELEAEEGTADAGGSPSPVHASPAEGAGQQAEDGAEQAAQQPAPSWPVPPGGVKSDYLLPPGFSIPITSEDSKLPPGFPGPVPHVRPPPPPPSDALEQGDRPSDLS